MDDRIYRTGPQRACDDLLVTAQQTPADQPRSFSVVIAAHNEGAIIGSLLRGLTERAHLGEVSVIVACNGCTDDTAEVARSFGASVTVLELPVPSKRQAQRAGDAAAMDLFPRAYIDADVLTTVEDLRELMVPLVADQVLATAPLRRLESSGSSWVVTRYYNVWGRLPQVRDGLFGRGVVMVSDVGAKRILALPDVMSDDLAMSEVFLPKERRIVEQAAVTVHLPRTVSDLLRRRIRVVTGNAQVDELRLRGPRSMTSTSALLGMVRTEPRIATDVAVFLAVTLVARVRARRRVSGGDFTTWLRDESSRARPRA